MSTKRGPGRAVHKLPADLRKALVDNTTALAAWEDITPLGRNASICQATTFICTSPDRNSFYNDSRTLSKSTSLGYADCSALPASGSNRSAQPTPKWPEQYDHWPAVAHGRSTTAAAWR